MRIPMSDKKIDESKVFQEPIYEFDVTEEAKRLLEAKKNKRGLQPGEDCECKDLSDAEMFQAAKTSHDIRTGKIDVEDIQSPVSIHPRLVEEATCSPSRGETPKGEECWRKLAGINNQKTHDDMKEFIDLSKKVVESLIGNKTVQQHMEDDALQIMSDAISRERDKEIAFVPVSGLDPREAAKRVIRLKDEYTDVEPVDLTGVLDDVNPICDLHIDKLQPIMHVKKTCLDEDLPDEIVFAVPNIDLPAPSETDPSDIRFANVRYVYLDSMPKELKTVVMTYLTTKRSTIGNPGYNFKYFKKAIAELARAAEVTFKDEE
jgi:hypothetical protein